MIEIILSSIAALSLTALGIYTLAKRRTAVDIALCISALLLAGIEICDQLSLRTSSDGETFRHATLVLESLLPGALLMLSFLYGRNKPFESQSRIRLALTAALALLPPALLAIAGTDLSYSPDLRNERVLFLGDEGYWYYIGVMAALIYSLVNIESTLAATYGIDRYRMKFEVIGIMSILAVLIFYYSQGLLYRSINLNLIPIRSTITLVSIVMIFYSRVFRGSGAPVLISRQVLYRSITMLAVGLYLIGLGIIGEGMRYFGETFGRNLAIVVAFVIGMGLLAVFLSETLRRRVKVFISKNFYVHKHDYRGAWLSFTNQLASCLTLTDVENAVLTSYQDRFGVRGGALYLAGREKLQFVLVAEHEMERIPMELRISGELEGYFIQQERVLDLTDTEHPLSEAVKSIFTNAGVWLVVPLMSGGRVEGLALLREQIVPERLTYEDYDLMKVLARQAAQAVVNLRLSEELMETRAIAAVARISSFVIHDLKNSTTSLSLVVDNAKEHMGNPDFQQDAIKTIGNTLAKMKSLIQRLKSIPEKLSLEARVEDLDRLSRETVAEIAKIRPGMRIVYKGSPVFSCVDGEEIKKVIENLVQNALDASGEQGTVTVATCGENGGACIRISDSGKGMDEDFLKNHLFRPFRTTKDKGLGIGLYQCKQIVEAHGGRLEAQSAVGKGSVFTVVLPVAEGAADK